jgi:hypothetical protein
MKKILVAILGVGFLYRILFLGKRQLWTEELMQALVAQSSSLEEMMSRLYGGVPSPAPLDYFVQKCFVFVLGDANWALRFHAVILGTLSLWFFFRIGKQLFNGRVALYATALLAFYPLHYHYSQEGRPLALVVLLTLISFDLLLREFAGRNSGRKRWTALALVLVLLLYSSLLGILVLAAQLSCLIASASLAAKLRSKAASGSGSEGMPDLSSARWKHVFAYVLAAMTACVLFIPWMHYLWGSPAIPQAEPGAHFRLLLGFVREIGDNSPFVVVLLIAGVIAGSRALLLHCRKQALLWLLTWSGVLVLGIVILDILSEGWYANRYLLLVVPPLVLIAGYGLSYVGERMTILDELPYRMSSPASVYLGMLVLASAWIAQSHWKKEPVDWRGAAGFLQQTIRPGDTVAMPKIYPLLEYYAPSLEEFRVGDLDPGPVLLGNGNVKRRFVVCLNEIHPDPCAAFRVAASKNRAWGRLESLRGFTLYLR